MIDRDSHSASFESAVNDLLSLVERRRQFKIPSSVTFIVGYFDEDPQFHNTESFKFLGGRLLTKAQVRQSSLNDVIQFTCVNGTVPRWINLHYLSHDESHTTFRMVTSQTLTDDPSRLYVMENGRVQFRLFVG